MRAMVHIRFVCELCQMQMDAGRYFLQEHPATATSWSEACIQNIMTQEGVDVVGALEEVVPCHAGFDGMVWEAGPEVRRASPRVVPPGFVVEVPYP